MTAKTEIVPVHIKVDKDVYDFFEKRCMRYGDRSRYYRAGMRDFMETLKAIDRKTGEFNADIVDGIKD
jgi:hypothetical protein|tara:strand:+ start:867 stop:1070 length:204 start_codon:yes stop_codon:yes gene_type:complete